MSPSKKKKIANINSIKKTNGRLSSFDQNKLTSWAEELNRITYPELSCYNNSVIFYLNKDNEICYKTKFHGEEIHVVIEETLRNKITEQQKSSAKTPREKKEVDQKIKNILSDVKNILSTPDLYPLENRLKKLDGDLPLILRNIVSETDQTWHPVKNFSPKEQVCDFFDAMIQHPEKTDDIKYIFYQYNVFFATHPELQQRCLKRMDIISSLATSPCQEEHLEEKIREMLKASKAYNTNHDYAFFGGTPPSTQAPFKTIEPE